MADWQSLLGLPPGPIGAGVLVLASLIWGMNAKKKQRPLLMAIQVSLLAVFLQHLFSALSAGIGFFSALAVNILGMTFGAYLLHVFVAWLIIRLAFLLRFRNDNSRIFTRNRSL